LTAFGLGFISPNDGKLCSVRLNEGLGVADLDGDMKLRFAWNWQIATFWVGCFVMLVNLLTAAVNRQIFEQRKLIWARLEALEQTSAALLADMQGSRTTPQPPQKKQQ